MLRITVVTVAASFAFLAAADPWSATLVDLASEWGLGDLYNANQGATRFAEELANQGADINGYVVVVGGKIVAEGYGPDRNQKSISQIWSVTKSWSSMLIGTLVRDGRVTPEATLDEIFPDAQWSEVQDADAKRNITLWQLLTMRAGLSGGGDALQNSLVDSLNYCQHDSNREGVFDYVNHHLLAHVVHAITGETTGAYAERAIWPLLGISADELVWWNGTDLVQWSAFGLNMSPRQIAKLGQLYLQRGLTAPGGTQLVTPDWIDSSITPWNGSACTQNCGDGPSAVGPAQQQTGYGYQWWIPLGGDDELLFDAAGWQGQYIRVFPERDMVVAITKTDTTDKAAAEVLLALLDNVDFSEPVESTTTTVEDSAAAPSCFAGLGLLALVATAAILSFGPLE